MTKPKFYLHYLKVVGNQVMNVSRLQVLRMPNDRDAAGRKMKLVT